MSIIQEVEKDTKQQLTKLLRERKRRRGLTDLHFLATKILGYTDLTSEDGFHGDYCRHLENKKYKLKLSLAPRGSLKTTLGTITAAIQDILNNPNTRGLLVSEKFSIATAILAEIKGHFEKNEELRLLYGDFVGTETWSKHEIIVKPRTIWKASPTIACGGVDVTKVGMHYDWIRVEDPHSDQNTNSQDAIDKVIRWFKLLFSLLDPGGYLYVNGTIWHYNDLYNYIQLQERQRVANGMKKRYRIFKRDSFKGTLDDLMNGRVTEDKLLWPERLSAEFLKDQLIEQGPFIFNCQYRLTPTDDENAIFKRSWIKTCKLSDIPENLSIFSTVDPMVDEEGKDFLSIITCGMDTSWRAYILDVVRMKADEHDTVDAMFDVYQRYKPEKIGIESVAWQKSYFKYVQMLQIMRGMRLPITKLKTDTKKTKRMRVKSMVPYWKAGLFIVPCKNADLDLLKGNMASLVDELTRYPKTANDDCVDALAYMDQLTHRPGVVHILRKLDPKSFNAIRSQIIRTAKQKRVLGSRHVRGYAN